MNLSLPLSTIYGFLLVLARVAGLLAFLPVPGLRNAPMIFRAVLFMFSFRDKSSKPTASRAAERDGSRPRR